MLLTYLLLALSVAALWLGGDERTPAWRRQAWLFVLLGAGLAGLGSGSVRPVGFFAMIAFLALAWACNRPQFSGRVRSALAVALLFFAGALMLHAVPGFVNPKVIAGVRFTPDALPFSLYLNFDKTLVGLAIVGWGLPRLARASDFRAMLRVALPVVVLLAVVLMGLSLAAGYVRWAPKFPPESWLWLGVNLGFVCLAEEALFRGFIQRELQLALGRYRHGPMVALAVAALLFGLAHAAGGATYVALATVAGLGYGWVYQRTGRIEAAVLVHWMVNTVHFLGFTYPALA